MNSSETKTWGDIFLHLQQNPTFCRSLILCCQSAIITQPLQVLWQRALTKKHVSLCTPQESAFII